MHWLQSRQYQEYIFRGPKPTITPTATGATVSQFTLAGLGSGTARHTRNIWCKLPKSRWQCSSGPSHICWGNLRRRRCYYRKWKSHYRSINSNPTAPNDIPSRNLPQSTMDSWSSAWQWSDHRSNSNSDICWNDNILIVLHSTIKSWHTTMMNTRVFINTSTFSKPRFNII